MSFMLIIREQRGQRDTRSEEEGKAVYGAMLNFGAALAQRGILLASESLRTDDSAVRIQIRDGDTRVMDGPFTESREMVGGFFLLDVSSREEAIEIARQCPAAAFATVEVRELAPCYEK